MDNNILLLNLHRKIFRANYNHGDFAGLHLIAAFLGKNGFESKVFGGDLHEGWKVIEQECSDRSLKMIGLYCDFENAPAIEELCRRIKAKYEIAIVVGGPQATVLTDQFLLDSGCDVIVRGEGELTMLELAQYYIDKAGKLNNIDGIAFWEKGSFVETPPQSLIENLDAVPFIDAKYSINHDFRIESSAIMTGRGCPFHCAFCHEGHHTKKVRFRSVDNVLREIRQIFYNHPQQKYLFFTDDTFTLHPGRVKELCVGMQELQKTHSFIWFCEGHVKTLCQYPAMIDEMVAAGLHRIQLGIEAGTREVLEAYRKGATPEDIKQLVALCRDKGVRQLYSNIILGGALFSKEIWERDKQFIKEILEIGQGVLEIGVVFFWPLPETAMTKNPSAYGISVQDGDFLTSIGDFPLTSTEDLSVWDINELGRELGREIVEHMEIMLKEQIIPHERILSWFQTEKKFHTGGGLWFELVNHKEIMGKYYDLLACGALCRSKEIEVNCLATWHPQRVIVMQQHVRTDSTGDSYIDDIRLSHMEKELLRYSTGKLTSRAVFDRVYQDMKPMFTSLEDYQQAALQAMEKMEQRYWLAYSEF